MPLFRDGTTAVTQEVTGVTMMDDETAGKMAEAATEIAKTTGTALEIVKGAGGFLNKLVGESLTELGQALTDRIRIWRARNLLSAANKARIAQDALGPSVEFRQIPEGDAIRWI